MSKQQRVISLDDSLIDTIKEFFRAPPEGTPREIISAFEEYSANNSVLTPGIFLQTVEQAPVSISITDPNAKILYVNSAFEKLTGYEREEIIGQNQSTLSSQSTPIAVYQELWDTIKNKKVWNGTLINHRKDKEEYIADLTISPVLSNSGDISYFLGMHHNITEVHKLEQNLKFQKHLTESAINVAPMVVVMMKTSGEVVLDNLAYKALLGDFRGIEPAGLLLEQLKNQIDFDIADVTAKDKEFTNIEVGLEPPGQILTRWFSCSGVCIRRVDDSVENYFKNEKFKQHYILLIANEITAQRRRTNEARLNMIRANMVEQQLEKTMREAISAAVYKLQVPMNVMKAAISIPGSGNHDCNLRNTLIQAIESADEAMVSLQDAIPRPNTEHSTMLNINAIIHEVIKLSTEVLLASGIVIDWRPASVLPLIQGKANALRGLFKYLIDNAIQATNDTAQYDKELRIDTKIKNQEILVEVIDNGTGLSDELRLKVFEPFFCGWKRAGTHAGMGLTMAQEIIVDHGGYIEIDPEFYGGCRVFVHLPVNEVEGE